MDVHNHDDASYLQNYVREIVQQRGWTGAESAANDDLTRLNNLLSLVDGILLNVFPDGSIHSIYGPMETFIEYSSDEISNIYELLDSGYSDEVRCILSQQEFVAGDGLAGHKISFRIKPAPKTPRHNHKFCLFDCFFKRFSQSSSSFCSLLCLRYDWIQLTITTSLPRQQQDIEFWSITDGKKSELNWITDVEIHNPPSKSVRNSDTDLFIDTFKDIIFRELIGSYSTESTRRMNNMWHTLRSSPSRETDKRTSVLNITQLEQSSMEVHQHKRESFLSKIRATGISEDELKRLKLIINTTLRIVINKRSHQAKKEYCYLTLEEATKSASNSSAESNQFLMEFNHRISIPNEVLRIATRSLPKKQQMKSNSGGKSSSKNNQNSPAKNSQAGSSVVKGTPNSRPKRNSPRNTKGTVIYRLLSDDNFSNSFYTEYLQSQKERSRKSPIRSPGSDSRKSDKSAGSPMIAEKDTPILKELLRKNDEESTSRSRRGTKRPKDDDFISGPRDTGLNDGPPPPSLSCRSNDSGSSNTMMLQQNQNQRISPTPQLTEEQKQAKLEEEKTERYIKFVTAFSKRARAAMEQQQQQQANSSVNQATPNPPTSQCPPVQRQNSQPMVSTESKGAFQEGDSQIRRMLVSKDGPAVFQPNRGAHNLNAPKRLNRSGSVPSNSMNSQPQVQQQMHHQQHLQPPQLSPQPGMNNQFNQGKPLEVVNVVQVSPRGYQQRSPQDLQMERRRSYGDVNTLQNYVPNSPMSPHFPQNADFQMAKDESKNQFIAPPNRSRNQSLPPTDLNGQIQSMTSPLQSPVSPMGGPVSPYASSMPSPSGPMMSPVMGPQKNFFGHPTSQMSGPLRVSPIQQGPNNKPGNNGGQMHQVQGSHKTVQSYPNIIGILNPAQRNNQHRFTVQQSRPNFNQPQQQHNRIPASMSHPMSYSQQMSPNPQPLPAQNRMTNNNHQQQYALQMAPQKQHQQSTLSNDLKDLSLPLLGSNDFSSDLGCLDFLDNEMPLNGAFESTNKLIQ